MSEHSIYSPSGSKRWLTCTASVGYIEKNKDRCDFGDTKESSEGTVAHEWCAAVLKNEAELCDIPDPEMRERVRGYVEFVWSVADEVTYGMDIHVEDEVSLFYMEQDHGTVDCSFVRDDTLYIIDYKDGAGVDVAAIGNSQLVIYAMSRMKELNCVPQKVAMIIYQPRFSPAVKRWDLTKGELVQEARRISSVVFDIEAGEVEFAPSLDACQFCPASGFCENRSRDVLTILPAGALAAPELPAPELMTDEQLALFVLKQKEFVRWLKDVEGYIHRRMVDEGVVVPGLKVVKGRDGNRRWGDEEGAEKFLEHKIGQRRWERKLISPTKAEKELKAMGAKHKRTWNRFESCVTRSTGKPVVVPEGDKREAIPTLECKFQAEKTENKRTQTEK